ncbi:YbjN domain-containing protein [Enterobacter hormaechei]
MIELGSLTNEKVMALLDKYLIDHNLEDDGDIFLENPSRLYIRIDEDVNVIRLMSFINMNIFSEEQQSDVYKLVNEANKASYALKFSTISVDDVVKAILCEYGIPMIGEVDDKFFIKIIRTIEKDIVDFKTYFPTISR